MPLLSEILNKHIDAVNFFGNKKNLEMAVNIDVSDEEGFFSYYYFSRLYYNKEGINYKIQLFKEIEENIFLGKNVKERLQIIFCKLQRAYYGFAKLAYLWRYKKATYKVTDDLSLNPIDIHKKNVFVLFQNNSKYLFVANDLINMINTNLTNSPNFFCNPLWTKNPYNNIELTHCDLYNIYFFLKFKVCNLPILFELFFKNNLSLKQFAYHNEAVIRSTKIDDYVKSSDNYTLYKTIIVMLADHNEIMNKIKIDKDFPRDKLIKIMRPYLHLYITSKYDIMGIEKKCISGMLLKKKLRDFAKFNPLFGRKKIITNIFLNKISPSTVTFNDKHINFYNKPEPDEVFQYNAVSDGESEVSDTNSVSSADQEQHQEEDCGHGGRADERRVRRKCKLKTKTKNNKKLFLFSIHTNYYVQFHTTGHLHHVFFQC